MESVDSNTSTPHFKHYMPGKKEGETRQQYQDRIIQMREAHWKEVEKTIAQKRPSARYKGKALPPIIPGKFQNCDARRVAEVQKALGETTRQDTLRHKEIVYLVRQRKALKAQASTLWSIHPDALKAIANNKGWGSPPEEYMKMTREGNRPPDMQVCSMWPSAFTRLIDCWDEKYLVEFPEVTARKHLGEDSFHDFLTEFSRDFLADPPPFIQKELGWEKKEDYVPEVSREGGRISELEKRLKAFQVEVEGEPVEEDDDNDKALDRTIAAATQQVAPKLRVLGGLAQLTREAKWLAEQADKEETLTELSKLIDASHETAKIEYDNAQADIKAIAERSKRAKKRLDETAQQQKLIRAAIAICQVKQQRDVTTANTPSAPANQPAKKKVTPAKPPQKGNKRKSPAKKATTPKSQSECEESALEISSESEPSQIGQGRLRKMVPPAKKRKPQKAEVPKSPEIKPAENNKAADTATGKEVEENHTEGEVTEDDLVSVPEQSETEKGKAAAQPNQQKAKPAVQKDAQSPSSPETKANKNKKAGTPTPKASPKMKPAKKPTRPLLAIMDADRSQQTSAPLVHPPLPAAEEEEDSEGCRTARETESRSPSAEREPSPEYKMKKVKELRQEPPRTEEEEILFAKKMGLACPFIPELGRHIVIPKNFPERGAKREKIVSYSAQRVYTPDEIEALWRWKEQNENKNDPKSNTNGNR